MFVIYGNNAALAQFSSKEEATWHAVSYNTCKKKISDIRDQVGVSAFTDHLFKDRLIL